MFQGDPTAPHNFNLMLDSEVVLPFVRHAERQGWGVELSHEDLAVLEASAHNRPWKRARTQTLRLSVLVFADNFGYWQLCGASCRR